MSKEAMKLALEALEQLDGIDTETECVTFDVGEAITALREALAAQPAQQEPVAWVDKYGEIYKDVPEVLSTDTPLYTSPLAQRTWVGLDWLPEHKCGLHLSHNEHRDVYETVEEFYEADDFISPEEWHKAVKEDSVWVLHWYPNTPVGFIRIAASTLEAIETKIKENT